MKHGFQVRRLVKQQQKRRFSRRINGGMTTRIRSILLAPLLALGSIKNVRFFSGGGTKQKIIKSIKIIFIIGVVSVISYLGYQWMTLPDVSDPRSFLASESTVITDRNGIELYRLFQEENRTFLNGALIPDHMKHAIIAIEDERYYDRGCLDLRALARVAISLGKSGGGSTLTRQLARNALDLKSEGLVSRKVKELFLGCQMERAYDKEELIELYLNWIPFGRNAYGVEQASQVYFGISAQELSLAKSSILASLPQRPTYFSPYGKHVYTKVSEAIDEKVANGQITSISEIPDEKITIGLLGNKIGTGSNVLYIGGRTDQVLQNMTDQGWISEEEKSAALEELKTIEFQQSREDIRAPHFVLWIRDQVEEMFAGTAEQGLLEHGGLTIETTLDWEIQQDAEAAVETNTELSKERYGANNIALLSVDTDTREVLAYVGNTDYNDTEHGGKIDMVQVPRQPGSSFKPFVYLSAFEKGYAPATVLFDVKTKIGNDEPQNFDGEFMGPMTIRQALGSSRNIPAAKAFFLGGGEQNILNLVANLGAPTPQERKEDLSEERGVFEYGWPLSLGAAETPLFEMTQAYATLANEGIYKPIISITKITDKNGNILYQPEPDLVGTKVIDPRNAYQVTSILSDVSARPDDYWKSQLSVAGFQTAAKTGTSNKCLEWSANGVCKLRKPDNAWLLGYTPEIVTGVWVGNADSSALYDKAGGLNSASPIWKDYMNKAHRKIEVTATTFTEPSGIVKPQVSLLSGQLPTSCTPIELRQADIFLRENAPTEPDPACQVLVVDKVTQLLASEACPEAAQEEGSFFAARSILPDRWPTWEQGVQEWMVEQMVKWNADETHSGSILKLPQAPVEYCDPALTPGRLVQPTITITTPRGKATHPAFAVEVDITVGSKVQNVTYFLNDRRVSIEERPPYKAMIRVPKSTSRGGFHTLRAVVLDEYFNQGEDEVQIQFGEDTGLPRVEIEQPTSRQVILAGTKLYMRASAEDSDGGIKYVQFYIDDTLLTTKPKEPYELQYTIDLEPGDYTLRAVAHDLADHTAEDRVRITVTNDEDATISSLSESEVSIGALEPVLLFPTTDTSSLAVDQVLDARLEVPTLGSGEFSSLKMYIEATDDSKRDMLLDLQDGGGIYKRSWKSKVPGTFYLIVETADQSRKTSEWVRHKIEVK